MKDRKAITFLIGMEASRSKNQRKKEHANVMIKEFENVVRTDDFHFRSREVNFIYFASQKIELGKNKIRQSNQLIYTCDTIYLI